MYKAFILLLVGCAADNTPDPPIVSPTPVIEPQKPAPVVTDIPEKPGPNCHIIQTVWGGNCRLDEYICDDGTYKLDGKCYPPDWVPPWKNLPDPPYGKGNVH